jgi:hypothetical protein
MKLTLILTITALALAAQPKASIVIRVVDDAGVLTTAKITGVPASAGLDTLAQFIATQQDCTGQPQVCTPKYADGADFVKKLLLSTVEQIAPKFPSAATKADVDEITAKIAALEAKRKQLFDAARAEK